MSSDVRIVVGTYGPAPWVKTAESAMLSAVEQTARCDVVHVHSDTLAKARNLGAAAPGSNWLVFLDGDDTLDQRYVERMLEAPQVDMRQPATLGVYPDGREDAEPVLIPPKPSIRQGNWFVIGTMVRRDLFLDAGGFGEEAAWEDWSAYSRMFGLGATWTSVPQAIYRVGVNDGSRNSKVAGDGRLFSEILAANDRWAAERGVAIR